MSFRKIVVIGVGSFGGFLCKHLSELDSVEQLYIIDDDIVETKNVRNSIYSMSDVGEYKVDALIDNIQDEVSVMGFGVSYLEGKTILPKDKDLVIDCRDLVCDRGNEIDVRLSISGKQLIIDCRKNVKCTRQYRGSYSINLPKSEISKAAFFASQIISSDQFKDLTDNKLIKIIDLDILPGIIDKSIKETLQNKSDLIYEVFEHTNRINGLEENIEPIMKLNAQSDVIVKVSDNPSEHIITKDSLFTSSDLIERLTEMVKEQNDFTNFIVVMKERNNMPYVELIEESGGS
jgi:hypothetical protein